MSDRYPHVWEREVVILGATHGDAPAGQGNELSTARLPDLNVGGHRRRTGYRRHVSKYRGPVVGRPVAHDDDGPSHLEVSGRRALLSRPSARWRPSAPKHSGAPGAPRLCSRLCSVRRWRGEAPHRPLHGLGLPPPDRGPRRPARGLQRRPRDHGRLARPGRDGPERAAGAQPATAGALRPGPGADEHTLAMRRRVSPLTQPQLRHLHPSLHRTHLQVGTPPHPTPAPRGRPADRSRTGGCALSGKQGAAAPPPSPPRRRTEGAPRVCDQDVHLTAPRGPPRRLAQARRPRARPAGVQVWLTRPAG